MKRRSFLGLVFVLAACKKDPPPTPPASIAEPFVADASVAVVATAPAVAKPAEIKAAADLEAFFPVDGALGTKRTFTQEKLGYAEAKVQQGTKDIAVLSITDTSDDPAAKGKFANVADKLDGMPFVTISKTQSALLAKDRYVLSVTSQTLDDKGRKIWLGHFNLKRLLF